MKATAMSCMTRYAFSNITLDWDCAATGAAAAATTASSLKTTLSGRLLNPAAVEFVPSFGTRKSSSSFPNLALDMPAADVPQPSDLSTSAPAVPSPLSRNDSAATDAQPNGMANGAHSTAEADLAPGTANGSSGTENGAPTLSDMAAELRLMIDKLDGLAQQGTRAGFEDEAATVAQVYALPRSAS